MYAQTTQVPYSGKLLREKTFTNFATFQPSAKVFSLENFPLYGNLMPSPSYAKREKGSGEKDRTSYRFPTLKIVRGQSDCSSVVT